MSAIAELRSDAASPRALLIAWWTLLAACVIAATVARIHLLPVPLERDEGEYAYTGQLMLEGIAPYKLAYTMKYPGTHASYALVMLLFGQTSTGIHLGLLFVNFATVVLLYFLGRRLFGTVCGIASAACYAVLSISPSVLGFAAHATQFLVLPVVAGAFLLVRRGKPPRMTAVCVAGVLFGVALLMKQSAIFFVGFAGAYLLLRDRRGDVVWARMIARVIALAAAATVPLALTCILLWKAGVFGTFWFWTVKYAREYARIVSAAEAWEIFRIAAPQVVGWGWGLWIIGLLGVVVSLWNRRTRFDALSFLCPFALCGALSVLPGFYFRPHYFVQLLPVLALFSGTAIAVTSAHERRLLAWIALTVFAAAAGLVLWSERIFLFRLPPAEVPRAAYGNIPFTEAVSVGQFLRERSNPGDRIAVLGSEPEIYFYSHRHSATGYIYTYGLMERQPYARDMQRAMIAEIEAAQPRFFVLVGFGYSWMQRADSDVMIFDWFKRYSADNLRGIGVVNAVSLNQSVYYLPYRGEPLQLGRNYILIYERR